MSDIGNRVRAGLAELAIIVVGVLIALGVDSWWSTLQDRSSEREYLAAILHDLRTDSLEFEAVGEVLRRASEYTVHTLEHGETSEGISTSVGGAAAIYCASFLPVPVIGRATLEDLLSTGALQLLKARAVRGAFLEYHGRAEAELQWIEEYRASQANYRTVLGGLGLPQLFAEVGGPARVARETGDELLTELRARPDSKATLNRMLFAQQRMLVHIGRLADQVNELIPVVAEELSRVGGQAADVAPPEAPSGYMLQNSQCFPGAAP